eukprot:TRINITY_DN26537_c0_g3_i1.p1 TRINITY_DN26537_c0_g3~~TRINITY_DN26537_c0_g3_i1.p1  ORF type:complete len:162 (+),score=31.33 TRINITY_DN26537_c0_g3_i1:300-785(+)
MCPTLLVTGSCRFAECCYAHRREDLQGKKKRFDAPKEEVTDQLSSGDPQKLPAVFGDFPPKALSDDRACEDGSGEVKGIQKRGTFGSGAPTTRTSAHHGKLANSDVGSPHGFVHHGFLVRERKTFIDVEHVNMPLFVGMSRAASAPGRLCEGDGTNRTHSI